jgi:hypothetical protein
MEAREKCCVEGIMFPFLVMHDHSVEIVNRS